MVLTSYRFWCNILLVLKNKVNYTSCPLDSAFTSQWHLIFVSNGLEKSDIRMSWAQIGRFYHYHRLRICLWAWNWPACLTFYYPNTSFHDVLDVVGEKKKYKGCTIYVYFKILKITFRFVLLWDLNFLKIFFLSLRLNGQVHLSFLF